MRKAQRRTNIRLWTIAAVLMALVACKKKAEVNDAPLPATTTVSSADLTMRIAPNTTAVEIARLTQGEQVRIVQRSAESVQIGKLNAHWYKVTNATGLTGWVYGAHLAIEANNIEETETYAKTIKKLREVLTGRWEAATVQGALTTSYVTLYSDGKVAFGTDKGKTQTGTYKLVFEGPVAVINIVGIKKPMMTNIKAKMIGETLVFNATMENEEYKLTLSDKGTGELLYEEEAAPPVVAKP